MANLLDTLIATKELEVLVTALQITDLDKTLTSTDNFTIFAPNNRAFMQLEKTKLQQLSQDIPLLTNILSMHIVHGKLTNRALSSMCTQDDRKITLKSIHGLPLYIDLSHGIKIGNSTILSIDMSPDNGIIYPIDRVIMPE
jgi:uncharacterized surface protein with fasciclin (FAS1) repeats